MPTRFIKLCITLLCCCGLSGGVQAEQKKTLGGWDVHYMVVNTSFLAPDIAKSYGIARSKYNALVNISVLDAASSRALSPDVMGHATNLLGTKKSLAFKRVTEGEAVYYLATLPFDDRDTFRFVIDINDGSQQQTLRFQQELWVD